jgi:hypothetical protein
VRSYSIVVTSEHGDHNVVEQDISLHYEDEQGTEYDTAAVIVAVVDADHDPAQVGFVSYIRRATLTNVVG